MPHKITLFDILIHTPAWVWLLLALLVWLGLSATRDREVTAPRLAILPLVITYLASRGILTTAHSLAGLLAVATGAGLGIAAGAARFYATGAIQVTRGTLRLKGEWITMVVVITIFALHYAEGVLAGIGSPLTASPAYRIAAGSISAFFATMNIMLAIYRIHAAYAPADGTAGAGIFKHVIQWFE